MLIVNCPTSIVFEPVLSQVVELIENKSKFAITTHIKPDGDGVGSSLGLCWLLRSLGKTAEVIVHGDVPPAYMSLPGADEIRDVVDAVRVGHCPDQRGLLRPEIYRDERIISKACPT